MSQEIRVPALARVEGEGGLRVEIDNGNVVDVELNIYEPPRFFEGFLRGRFVQDVPDITARICGICPVAYQMSSVRALEAALAIEPSPEVTALRKLFYAAEHIQSHVLHMYMLQAPDLLGLPSALAIAQNAPEIVQRAVRMKAVGDRIMAVIGGRSIHPVNTCVGGFYSWPDKGELRELLPEVEWGLGAAFTTAEWACGLDFPDFEVDYHMVAVHDPDEYAILAGDILSSRDGLIPEQEFEQHYLEFQVQHSTALHSHAGDQAAYLVGPLARYNLNFDQLRPAARGAAERLKLDPPILNPYRAMLARAIETIEAFAAAHELIESYEPRGASRAPVASRSGRGAAVSEAPRGLLYHRYSVRADGLIEEARIVPPTAQNLARIEADLWKVLPALLVGPHLEAQQGCEALIRAYDPCISCSTHFLRLEVEGQESPLRDLTAIS